MNRGRRRKAIPGLQNANVEFVKAEPEPSGKWRVTINVNGWPYSLRMDAKDELDAMRIVYAMQRGEISHFVSDISQ